MASNLFDEYRGRSVLITGGLGFIGSNLAHRLAEIGDVSVQIIDSLAPDQGGNPFNLYPLADRVSVRVADVGDESVIGSLVSGVDVIFNLAGSTSHVESMRDPHGDLRSNCLAQLTLLEACRRFNPHTKIVYTSTRQVYGRPLYLPVDEAHRLDPPDINGIHKLAAENYHLLYGSIYGLRPVCLRLTNVYGPRQMLRHERQSFISWFIRQALDGRAIELFGEGKQRRDLLYVDDAVEALLLAGANEAADGEIYNVGGPEPTSLVEIADLLIELAGQGSVRAVPFPPERQQIEIGNSYSSRRKINHELGWEPRTSLRAGLAATLDFYRQHRAHYLGDSPNDATVAPLSHALLAASSTAHD